MRKISIIVPTYNRNDSIEKCIMSIVNQNYENLEIVVVDDGSNDNSEQIILGLANLYDCIKYFKKENGGISSARNYGIEKSTGEYLGFVDSDDYMEDGLLQNIKKFIDQDIDLIKFKYKSITKLTNDNNSNEECELVEGPVFDIQTGESGFNKLFGHDNMIEVPWLYFYKKCFWIENNFKYPEGKCHEDFAITPLVILKAKTFISTDIIGYNYNQINSSITRGNSDEKKMKRSTDLLDHYDFMVKEIEKYNLENLTKENVKIFYSNSLILQIKELNGDSKKKYIHELKKRKVYKNFKTRNFKQLIKKILLYINVDLYLKLR